MKKVLVFIMAMLYITTTSGVAVNVHYCMDKMVSVTYGSKGDGSCGFCGMEQKKGCCHTDHKFVKSGSNHLLAQAAVQYLLTPAIALAPDHNIFFDYRIAAAAHSTPPPYHSPPDQRANILMIYTCVFRV